MLAAACATFLPAIEDGRQNLLETLWPKQPLGNVLGNQVVELSIGMERPLEPVSPCRALMEQV